MTKLQYIIPSLLVVVSIIQLISGVLIYSRNKSNRINLVFLLLMITLSLWSALMGSAYYFSNFSYSLTLFLTRLLTVPAFFFPIVFLYFALIFPENTYKNNPAFFVFNSAFILFLLSFLFSNYYIKSSVIVPGGIDFKYGVIYIILGIYVVTVMIYGCYVLLKKLTDLKGIKRHQVLLFTIGSLISIVVGMIFAFILPAFNIYLNFLAPTGTLFCIGFLAYAIIKTRFMDIRIVINRLMAFFVLTIIYLLLGAVSIYLFTLFFVFGLNISTMIFLVLLFLSSCLSFHPLRLHLQTTPDRFIFRKKYVYETAIKELGQKCGSLVDGDRLVGLFSQKIKKVIETDEFEIHIVN